MNTSLRLLLGMAILSIPAVGLQVLRPGWLQDARRELGVLRESRARVTTEGERKERLAEATTSATARRATQADPKASALWKWAVTRKPRRQSPH